VTRVKPASPKPSSFAKTKSRAAPNQTQEASGIVRVAAVQMASGPNVAANLAEAERLINTAVNRAPSWSRCRSSSPSWG
jgi:hypothetical protein